MAYILVTDEPPVGKEAQASQVASKHVVNIPLEPFLVNLADKESRRYLKLKVELEVDSEGTAKEMEKSMPRMRDALILLLSSKTYLDLSSYQGKQQLKQEIKQKITALPGGNKISDVFFTEFVAQYIHLSNLTCGSVFGGQVKLRFTSQKPRYIPTPTCLSSFIRTLSSCSLLAGPILAKLLQG